VAIGHVVDLSGPFATATGQEMIGAEPLETAKEKNKWNTGFLLADQGASDDLPNPMSDRLEAFKLYN